MTIIDSKVWLQTFVSWLLVALFIVWPMPGTIALRYLVLSVLLCIAMYFIGVKNHKLTEITVTKKVFWAPLYMLLTLSFWILVSFIWFSVDSVTVRAEILGQWVPAVACFALGGSLSYAGLKFHNAGNIGETSATLIWPVFIGTGVLVLFSVFLDGVYYVASGTLPYIVGSSALAPQVIYQKISQGLSIQNSIVGESPDRFSMVVFLYVSIIFAEIFSRIKSKSVFPIKNSLAIAFLIMGLVAHYFVRNRNGNVVFLAEMAITLISVYFLYRERFSKATTLFIALLFASLLFASGMLFFKADQRWNDFLDTVPIALDTKNNTVWLTRDAKAYPTLADGRVVDNSNYDRVAWAKEGMLLIFDNPLGTGFNRNAFGDGIDSKYQRHGLSRGGHSHSGLIDFTIANGLPGLFLWLGFIVSMVVLGVINLAKGNFWSGLFLIVYPSGFLMRSLLDSVIRDNYLQQFMFVVGLLWVWSSCRMLQPVPCVGADKGSLQRGEFK